MEEEEAQLISQNGGKKLNYFLMPKSYKHTDGDGKHYHVPLVFGRLYAQAKFGNL